MEPKTKITCPGCGRELNVNEIVFSTLEAEFQKKLSRSLEEEKKKYDSLLESVRLNQQKLEDERRSLNEIVNKSVSEKLRKEREHLETEIRNKVINEESSKYETVQKELKEKSEKLKDLNQFKAEVERLKREKDELKDEIEAASQKVLNEKIMEEKEKIRKAESEKNELVVRELQKKLEDQKKLTEEMQRKQEQGSTQLQGEILELAIEDWIKCKFPHDTVEEIRKGMNGADCIQHVNTISGCCGKIYYESKRAKVFSTDWIEKFKNDMRMKDISVGVLVTQSMPKDMERMGMKEGIWICSYDEFKGLSAVLRDSIIRISQITATQENKGEKMEMLYNYLTGSAFRSQIEAIVEGFVSLRNDLEIEKRAMIARWKQRETQIDKVLLNTTELFSTVKGIGGNAIPPMKALEPGENTGKEFKDQ